MPITPLSTPLKTEYKPLGLEAFAQPLSQMQAKFDVAKSQIEDADYKIDALSWASGDQEATKALANSYNQKASDLAGKLIRSGNYREASSALKKINKDYNNDPGIQAYQSNAAGYKAIVAEMDKAVTAGTMTPEYRDTKLRKIRSEFSGTNFNPKTNAYNKFNASSAMNNIKIEDKIMKKAEKLANASAEEQSFYLGAEVTKKLRGADGRLAFDDIVAHLRQSTEFKEYSKEKAELDFFAENERALQSENPFALADNLIGTKIGEIDGILEQYAQNPEAAERDKEAIEKLLNTKEELLALAQNKTQDPQSYFGTAENIFISDHDYLKEMGGTAADIYDYQKIDKEKTGNTASAKEIEKINNTGPLSVEKIGVTSTNAIKVKPGSSGITQEKVLIEAGVDPEKADLGNYYTILDNDAAKQEAADAGKIIYTGVNIETNKKKVEALIESQNLLEGKIEKNSNLIELKRIDLEKNISANKRRMLESEIDQLQEQNLQYIGAKNAQTEIFSNLVTLSGVDKNQTKKEEISATKKEDGSYKIKGFNLTTARMTSPEYANKLLKAYIGANMTTYGKPGKTSLASIEQTIELDDVKYSNEISALAASYGSDITGFLEALTTKAEEFANSAPVKKKIEKEKISETELQEESVYISSFIAAEIYENGAKITNEEKDAKIKDFNVKSNSSLTRKDWTHYQGYLNGEHLEEDAKEEKELYVPYNGMDNKGPAPKGLKKGTNTADSKYTVIMDGYNKVQAALDKYEKNINYVSKLKVQNIDNPYGQVLNNVLDSYEEATTLKNARVQTVNAVVIDGTFAKKVPSATQFMTNAGSNLAEYVVQFDNNTNTISSDPSKTTNIVSKLYDTETMRSVAQVEKNGEIVNVYAINRKSTVSNDLLAAAFDGTDKKVGSVESSESFKNLNKKQIAAINKSNPSILYITDRGTNVNLINQAKLAEVNSLEKLQKASFEKESSGWVQAKNTTLNDLVNLALLDTKVREEYIAQADNLRENLMESIAFDFPPVAPSVIKTINQKTEYINNATGEVIVAKPGDKVYNTVEYSTTKNRKLAYRVTRNIIVGYNPNNTPIIKEQILESGPMKSSGIAQQMMKHSIMFGVGNPNTSIKDGKGNTFNTDLGF